MSFAAIAEKGDLLDGQDTPESNVWFETMRVDLLEGGSHALLERVRLHQSVEQLDSRREVLWLLEHVRWHMLAVPDRFGFIVCQMTKLGLYIYTRFAIMQGGFGSKKRADCWSTTVLSTPIFVKRGKIPGKYRGQMIPVGVALR